MVLNQTHVHAQGYMHVHFLLHRCSIRKAVCNNILASNIIIHILDALYPNPHFYHVMYKIKSIAVSWMSYNISMRSMCGYSFAAASFLCRLTNCCVEKDLRQLFPNICTTSFIHFGYILESPYLLGSFF